MLRKTSKRRSPSSAREINQRKRFSFESLENRVLFASDVSISDATAIEGSDTLKFVDGFVPSGRGGLDGARDVVFHDNSLYVASALTDGVRRYDAESGDFLGEFVQSGSGGLDWPESMAFDTDGNIYVSSTYSNEVLRYDAAGNFLVLQR